MLKKQPRSHLHNIINYIVGSGVTLLCSYYFYYGSLRTPDIYSLSNQIDKQECLFSKCSFALSASNRTCYNVLSEHHYANQSFNCGYQSIRLQCCFSYSHIFTSIQGHVTFITILILSFLPMLALAWQRNYDKRQAMNQLESI